MNRTAILALAILSVIGLTWLWHGPAGAGERLAARLEAHARRQLDKDEMFQVRAQAARAPLTRRLELSGPADDFQRREIKRRLETLPGVGAADWNPGSLPAEVAQ